MTQTQTNNLKRLCGWLERLRHEWNNRYGDGDDPIIINSVKHKIIETIRCNDLEFKILQNDKELREVTFFKEHFIDELDKFEGLVFFGHSKGGGSEMTGQISNWINLMYYYNLEFIDEIVDKLSNDDESIFYGTFEFSQLTDFNGTIKETVFSWYAGSYFWMNTDKIKMYLKENNIDLTNYFKDRFSVEKFPGEIFGGDKMRSLYDVKIDDNAYIYPEISYIGDYGFIYEILGHPEGAINSYDIMMHNVNNNIDTKM